jgi:hypothetical protein
MNTDIHGLKLESSSGTLGFDRIDRMYRIKISKT